MPRIKAATVPEHRAQMEAAILDAAEQILTEAGSARGLTMGAVATRVGIGRTSLYKYFDGLDELVEAVVARDFPRWMSAVQSAVDAADDPRAKVLAYGCSNLAEMSGGDHAWRAGLARVALSAQGRERIGLLHADLSKILVAPLQQLGAQPLDLYLAAVQALVNVGITQLDEHQDPGTVTTFVGHAIDRLLDGVASCAQPARSSGSGASDRQ